MKLRNFSIVMTVVAIFFPIIGSHLNIFTVLAYMATFVLLAGTIFYYINSHDH